MGFGQGGVSIIPALLKVFDFLWHGGSEIVLFRNVLIEVIGICFFNVFIGAPVLQGLRIQIHIVFIDFDRV